MDGFTAGLGFFGAGALCAVLLFAACIWLIRALDE